MWQGSNSRPLGHKGFEAMNQLLKKKKLKFSSEDP
jgi:hypothetical protein